MEPTWVTCSGCFLGKKKCQKNRKHQGFSSLTLTLVPDTFRLLTGQLGELSHRNGAAAKIVSKPILVQIGFRMISLQYIFIDLHVRIVMKHGLSISTCFWKQIVLFLLSLYWNQSSSPMAGRVAESHAAWKMITILPQVELSLMKGLWKPWVALKKTLY